MSEKYIVFGATGSIGSSLAEQLISSGNSVHLVARNEGELKNISNKLGCTSTVADVLEDGFIDKVKSDVPEAMGVAYCVGSIDLKPLNLITKKDYLKSFEINFFPVVDLIRKFQDTLKKNKASIVLFSTVAVKQGFPNHSIISPVKAALEGLTVSLASELSPNIRINCIAPSLSHSKMADKLLKNPKISEAIAKQHPLKRLGEGSDSAALANFLLGTNSSWITGQIIGVDGGRSNVG